MGPNNPQVSKENTCLSGREKLPASQPGSFHSLGCERSTNQCSDQPKSHQTLSKNPPSIIQCCRDEPPLQFQTMQASSLSHQTATRHCPKVAPGGAKPSAPPDSPSCLAELRRRPTSVASENMQGATQPALSGLSWLTCGDSSKAGIEQTQL